MKEKHIDSDYLENLSRRIDALRDDVAMLKNNNTPTIPIYDEAQFPVNSIEGQLAMGNDGLLYKYQAGTWTAVSGTLTGGLTGNLDTYEDHTTTVATGLTPTKVGWSRTSGAGLLNTGTLTSPTVIVGGVYSLVGYVVFNTASAAGVVGQLELVFKSGVTINADLENGGAISQTWGAVFPFSVTKLCYPGEKIEILLSHSDASGIAINMDAWLQQVMVPYVLS